jgi:transposase
MRSAFIEVVVSSGSRIGSRSLGRCMCYTLVNSCKLLGINPFAYLKDVLERAGSHPMSRAAELTPKRWKAALDAAR